MSSQKKSLIIGASGQVGRQLALAIGLEHVVLAGRTPQPGWAHLDLATLSGDPEPARRILCDEEIGAVYCVGGATDVERCQTDREWAMQTNYLGPAALAALCPQIPFVYYSTEYVFDGVSGPYDETSRVHPICVYGESKALGEQAILEAHASALILRTTVVYGQDAGAKNFLYALRRNLAAGVSMRVPDDQISTPTYNRDLAQASVLLVTQGESGVFHVCGPDLLSRYDFAVRCASLMDLDPGSIQRVSTADLNQKAPRPLNAGLLTGKLAATLPDFRLRNLEAGIEDWLASEV